MKKQININLSTDEVNNTFVECLLKEQDIKKNGKPKHRLINGQGVYNNFEFCQKKLKKQKAKITKLIELLHDSNEDISFLDLCLDKNGKRWTNSHVTAEKLLAMGIALKKIKYKLPKEEWKSLPFGIPTVVINDSKTAKLKLLAVKVLKYMKKSKNVKKLYEFEIAQSMDNTKAKASQKVKKNPIIETLNIR